MASARAPAGIPQAACRHRRNEHNIRSIHAQRCPSNCWINLPDGFSFHRAFVGGRAQALSRQKYLSKRRRHDEQQQRSDEHAAHDHGRQRPLHLTANAVRDRCRKQADARRKRGHQHRPHPLFGAVEYGLCDAHALGPELAVISDVQNPIHHRDAEQRDEADRRGHTEIEAREIQRDQATADRKRDAGDGQKTIAQRIEQPIEQDEDQKQRDRDYDQAGVACAFCRSSNSPAQMI